MKKFNEFLQSERGSFLMRCFLMLGFILVSASVFAEVGDISAVKTATDGVVKTGILIAKSIIGLVLAIALITVIYKVATNDPHSTQYIIGFIVAVVVCGVGYALIE